MKTLLPLILFAVSMTITLGAEKTFVREKNILKELSNAMSSRTNGRTDRDKKINKGFEWVIQGVNILGQVDDFISDRTKNIIRKLHVAYNENDRDGNIYPPGRSLNRNY
ncbi:uncharacterized protein LOC108624519 [Ceratina calcarata]|uniref:Uncharacterized protein LOC108624519 n=1 Tax=Ceratina calcarata TaxID=156304 RepID=A0AAJ7N619_9HYME|nr:uncharacterized protein LOC108624519 [Ceratina calcarata]